LDGKRHQKTSFFSFRGYFSSGKGKNAEKVRVGLRVLNNHAMRPALFQVLCDIKASTIDNQQNLHNSPGGVNGNGDYSKLGDDPSNAVDNTDPQQMRLDRMLESEGVTVGLGS